MEIEERYGKIIMTLDPDEAQELLDFFQQGRSPDLQQRWLGQLPRDWLGF